jgi:SPP1 family predicted phage head-tail adaptor
MRINEKPTNPGELNIKISLFQPTVITDAGGAQMLDKGSKIADVWAKWVNAHGSEVWTADMAGVKNSATVMIRWRSDVDETCLVEKGDRLFEIVSMDNIRERNEYIELKVKRIVKG